MPVELKPIRLVSRSKPGPRGVRETALQQRPNELTIGLVNNMPDSALEATERQFISLLESAAGTIPIRFSLYAFKEIPRGEHAARQIQARYAGVEELWNPSRNPHLDAIIVTGREPLAPNLNEEPYWASFTRLLDWARENTLSSIWSCLAAHAAVLHLDGIPRIRNGHKHCGVFECERLSEHRLTAGMPAGFRLPHSRWNGLSEEALRACGYDVLTNCSATGVDTFVREGQSLFVFFQGHPEYQSNALLLEYRRDVARYLRGESDAYPITPQNYFDHPTEVTLAAFREQAMTCRQEALLADISRVLAAASVENNWQPTAVHLYRNWLQYLLAKKLLGAKDELACSLGMRKAGPLGAPRETTETDATIARVWPRRLRALS